MNHDPRTPLAPPPAPAPVLEVRDLAVRFVTADGTGLPAVTGVSFDLHPARTLALLGESGSGKSATARALMGVLPAGAGQVTAGTAHLEGVELLGAAPARRREVNGARLAMVFQDAQTALNPVLPVGRQVVEALRRRTGMDRARARAEAVRLLGRVGIAAPERQVDRYPHQFSGGMRQRVMIAMAVSQRPAVLIADEPTTALDVTLQAQVLDLLADLRDEHGTALLLITHDMGVVAQTADDVAVMYAGRIVERGPADDVLTHPLHPYTEALLEAVPRRRHRGHDLPAIPGHPASLAQVPDGCGFRARCARADALCATAPPPVHGAPTGGTAPTGHTAWCHRPTAGPAAGPAPGAAAPVTAHVAPQEDA